jgi:peptidoglycan-associated lipoprotein
MKMKLTTFATTTLATLLIAVAGVGCKKTPTGVTPLPNAALTGESPTNNLPEGGKIPGSEVPTGGGPTATWDPANFNPDRAALAGDTIHFDFDSSVIKASEKTKVEAVATALKGNAAAKLLVEGNCDDRGTEEYNRALGERRALAAREMLATMGIDAQRIRTESFGKDKPVDPAQNEAAWAKNRRDDFVLMLPK